MGFNIITSKDSFSRLETTKEKGFYVNGELLYGVQDAKIESSLGDISELSIRVSVSAD